MKKIFLGFLLIIVSVSVMAQTSEMQGPVKDISSELASINQEIADAYQVEQDETQSVSNVQFQYTDINSLQMNIPIGSLKNASAVLNHKIKTKPKSTSPKTVSKKQTEDMYEMIINKMYALKKKYDNNPYVRISGFDVNIGIPPSVTVSIEFKK